MENAPIFTFTSHIAGKNAKVSIYSDRIEWLKPRGVSAGKITAGIMTGGTSLLMTGVKNGKSGTEMIPVKSISSVTTKRDGLLNTLVSVITSGNTVDFRVSHSEAAQVKDVLTQLVTGSHSSQQQTPVVDAAPAAAVPSPSSDLKPDVMVQLSKLAELRDAGVLTPEEFDTKKTELLARL